MSALGRSGATSAEAMRALNECRHHEQVSFQPSQSKSLDCEEVCMYIPVQMKTDEHTFLQSVHTKHAFPQNQMSPQLCGSSAWTSNHKLS
eukprot:1159851-Pelagomonas_calceolata.AAC.10